MKSSDSARVSISVKSRDSACVSTQQKCVHNGETLKGELLGLVQINKLG
jgi:hypothetical protein